jgi:tetratricopeptide (TPR) repeat protein
MSTGDAPAARTRTALLWAAALLALGGGAWAGLYFWRQHTARTHLAAAFDALDRWDFAAARKHLAARLELWPNDGLAHLYAAEAARRAGDFEKARKHLAECERLKYRTDRTTLEAILLRAQTGGLAEAEPVLLKCVEREDLEAPLILEALGLAHLHAYDLQRAHERFSRLLTIQPRNVFARVWQGRLFEAVLSHHLAVQEYRAALEADPEYLPARLALADRTFIDAKDYAAAAAQYRQVLDREPASREGALGLARCLRYLGRHAEAVALLDGALAAHGRDGALLLERGLLAQADAKPAEAEGFFRRALAEQPNDRQALYSLYLALERLGKRDEAAATRERWERVTADAERMEKLRSRVAKSPNDPALYCDAAELCLRNGDYAEGMRWLQGALLKDSAYPRAHALLADAYERQGLAELSAAHRRLAKGAGAGK